MDRNELRRKQLEAKAAKAARKGNVKKEIRLLVRAHGGKPAI